MRISKNDIKRSFNRSIKNLLLRHGILCSRVIPISNLDEFFPMVWPVPIGNDFVRLGAEHDGGYVIPNDLDGIKACFSPGVGGTTDFEEDMARLGIPSFMADGSINELPNQNSKFHFTKKYLGDRNTETEMRLADWISNEFRDEPGDFILQMDIEGAEYAVIYDTPLEVLRKFRILAIEFHHLDLLVSEGGFDLIRCAFAKILESFSVVHIHPCNNIKPISVDKFFIPTQMEFTFLRNNRIESMAREMGNEFKFSYPHKLDSPNSPKRFDYPLPKCWYTSRI